VIVMTQDLLALLLLVESVTVARLIKENAS
jgi:hypothetical protein